MKKNKIFSRVLQKKSPYEEKVNKIIKTLRILSISIPKFIRDQKPISKFTKPMFTVNHNVIRLYITFTCNLKCEGCRESCNLVSEADNLSLEQIKRFIHESIQQNRRWKTIGISGGEPTLHPQILEILEELIRYKKEHSPNTSLDLETNGLGPKVQSVLNKLPKEIRVVNSNKKNSNPEYHRTFHNAPIDHAMYKFSDFSNACVTIRDCGMCLTKYGYYPCGIAGGMDRILGFNLGLKKLPSPDCDMSATLKKLCRYCGEFFIFPHLKNGNTNKMSISWKRALKRYKKSKPNLPS